MWACSNCGAPLPGEARFCPSCGARAAPAPEAERQRKVISVVFADLVGYTARSETTDAEDVRELLERYFERVSAEVERFGGFVEKFIGDAVMAVFGAPVARGDDAERAVRAALQIPTAVGALNDEMPDAELRVRVGVNTGEAVVELDPSSEGTALVVGDMVNTASRLQSAAPPGRVLVGEETYRVTHRSIRYEPVEPIIAKNKLDPVPAWLAVEPISEFAQRPSETPFLGRASELDLLGDVWERVVRGRRAHLVTVLGEPGIGKSRLAEELAGRVQASGGRSLQVRELPYTQSAGYEAFGQLVKDVAGIFELDGDAVATEKLVRSLDGLGLSDPEVVRHLSVFVGTGEAPAEDRREVFEAARRFVEALAVRAADPPGVRRHPLGAPQHARPDRLAGGADQGRPDPAPVPRTTRAARHPADVGRRTELVLHDPPRPSGDGRRSRTRRAAHIVPGGRRRRADRGNRGREPVVHRGTVGVGRRGWRPRGPSHHGQGDDRRPTRRPAEGGAVGVERRSGRGQGLLARGAERARHGW